LIFYGSIDQLDTKSYSDHEREARTTRPRFYKGLIQLKFGQLGIRYDSSKYPDIEDDLGAR
jgi:hypothetical protein